MRNTMMVLLMGLLLAGCLGSETQDVDLSQDSGPPGSNNPPTISGDPPSAVSISIPYNFQPTANDPDGDPISFSVENKPRWASFDSSSGRMFGAATLGDVGVYDGIVIAASDGITTSALPPFAIEVVQSALGSVSLSWVAPTENEDGSFLQDLAGYIIYYGTQPGQYNRQLRITNPSLTTFVVGNLTPNSYYFAASAFNSAGLESATSGEVMRVVN